jgi:prophage tail gpP-like protein
MERKAPIDDRDRVSLIVNGKVYSGWKNAKIDLGIEQLAGAFSLEVSDIWPDQIESWSIAPGDSCTLKIGNDTVITGYIDSVATQEDANTHTINVQGRDKTGDLVDCSTTPREWANQTFEIIANEIMKPFGVPLLTQVDTADGGYQMKKAGKLKTPPKFALTGGGHLPRKAANPGETVHKLLERLAKIQGVLLISDGLGNLMVTQPGLNGKADDSLVQGQNLLKVDVEYSFANLFSQVTVKGQAHGATTPQVQALSAVQTVKPSATITRPAINTSLKGSAIGRYRPLILVADQQTTPEQARKRAAWEVGTREAKSQKVTCKVQGWRQSSGKLWTINTTVKVKARSVRKNQDMLISKISMEIGTQGTLCTMVLYSPGAFEVLQEIPFPDKPTGGGTGTPQRLSGAR